MSIKFGGGTDDLRSQLTLNKRNERSVKYVCVCVFVVLCIKIRHRLTERTTDVLE